MVRNEAGRLIAFYGKMGCLVYALKVFDVMVS